MYEYKVESYRLLEAEEGMNYMAAVGWRVISVIPHTSGLTVQVVVTYERETGY